MPFLRLVIFIKIIISCNATYVPKQKLSFPMPPFFRGISAPNMSKAAARSIDQYSTFNPFHVTRTVTAQLIARGSDGTVAIRPDSAKEMHTHVATVDVITWRVQRCTTLSAIESDYEIESFLIERTKRPRGGSFFFSSCGAR